MACNAPIDISPTNATYKCKTRCSYKYNYPESSCNATLASNYVSLTYDSNKPVNYNSSDYNVVGIQIYSKPIHSYGSQQSDGEIIIIHKSIANKILLVCVPIVKSQLSVKTSDNLTYLMNTLKSNPGGAKINNFITLNDFIGKTTFYNYNASNFLGLNCSQNADFIVYRPNDYSVPMTSDAFTTLQSLIKSHSYKVVTSFDSSMTKPTLYVNEQGPNMSTDDQIYIDCQPINKSEETIEISNEKNIPNEISFSLNFDFLKNSQLLQIMLCFIIFIIIMYVSYYSIEVVSRFFNPIVHRNRN
jgi:hypothetical protein